MLLAPNPDLERFDDPGTALGQRSNDLVPVVRQERRLGLGCQQCQYPEPELKYIGPVVALSQNFGHGTRDLVPYVDSL